MGAHPRGTLQFVRTLYAEQRGVNTEYCSVGGGEYRSILKVNTEVFQVNTEVF